MEFNNVLLDMVNDDNIEYYKDMIPAVFYNMLNLPGVICIGAAVDPDMDDEKSDKKASGEIVPVGVMLLSVAYFNRVEIIWLYVETEYREKEIGTNLLSQAFYLAKKMNREKLVAKIPAPEGSYNIEDDRSSFFLVRGFYANDDLHNGWMFNVGEFSRSKLVKLSTQLEKIRTSKEYKEQSVTLETIKPFTKLSDKYLREAYISAAEKISEESESKIPDTTVPLDISLASKRLSFAYVEDKIMKAFLLVEHIGNTYFPVFLKVDRDNMYAEKILILFALSELLKKAKDTDYVYIRCVTKDGIKMADEILKDMEMTPFRILQASNTDFDNAAANIDYMEELSIRASNEEENLPKSFKVTGFETMDGRKFSFENDRIIMKNDENE